MADAELDLLVACCRSAFAGVPVEEVPKNCDWGRVLRLARRHRVGALAWLGLAERQVPEPVAGLLRDESTRTIEANLRAAAESQRLLEAFERASLPLLFVKGLTLGALAYPHPFLKQSRDIDLLVPADRVEEAGSLLRKAGYRPEIPKRVALGAWHRRRKESAWRHDASGQWVDLHSRLSDNPRMIPPIGMGSPIQVVEVARGIGLPTLAGEELFAYLCVHGASSAWFRLKWITDLAALLRGADARETARLYRRSQSLGAGRAAGQALLLAHRLFGTRLGESLRSALHADPCSRWLERAALAQLAGRSALREPTERPFGTVTIHLTQLLLLPGMEFKISELRRQVFDIVG